MDKGSQQTSSTAISRRWWWNNRGRYNKGLIVAGVIAFLLYNILGPHLIGPFEEFDETGFLIAVHGIFYLAMMIVANIVYSFGWLIDIWLNKNDKQKFRERLFNVGYWFSVSLPILVILCIMTKFALQHK